MMSTIKSIYFLVSLVAVLQGVEAATQLRLVNGLLIFEDRHPLEVGSSSGSFSRNSGSSDIIPAADRGSSRRSNAIVESALISSNSTPSVLERSGLRERNNDLHGHGYLNRNRGGSLRHQRRLLKDAQASSTSTTTVRNIFIEHTVIVGAPTPTAERGNEIDPVPVIRADIDTESKVQTRSEGEIRPQTIELDTLNVNESESETNTSTTTPTPSKDAAVQPDAKSTSHDTAVNSVTTPTMDVITIVWYFSTFIALVAFFVVMVCSDKYCTRTHTKPEETVITAPATPAPSYREFAPPSYDSVMKKHKSRVFIIPMLNESGELKVPDEPGNTTSTAVGVAAGSQTHLVQVEVQKPVSQAVTNNVDENSSPSDQCKNNESVVSDQGDQLLSVVVVPTSQGDEVKSAAVVDRNVSR